MGHDLTLSWREAFGLRGLELIGGVLADEVTSHSPRGALLNAKYIRARSRARRPTRDHVHRPAPAARFPRQIRRRAPRQRPPALHGPAFRHGVRNSSHPRSSGSAIAESGTACTPRSTCWRQVVAADSRRYRGCRLALSAFAPDRLPLVLFSVPVHSVPSFPSSREKSPFFLPYPCAAGRRRGRKLSVTVGDAISIIIARHIFLFYVRPHENVRDPHRHATGRSTEAQRCGLARAPRSEREAIRDGRAGGSRLRGFTTTGPIRAASDGGPGAGLHGRFSAGSGLPVARSRRF